jgi:LmbE family N-acetylglucosaminyl deacetylase
MVNEVEALLVLAHPDDAEFAAAGTVARWTREGKQVVYLVCTNGNKGTIDRTLDPADLAAVREQEQKAAANILGVKEVAFLHYPDQGLEDTPEFRKQIVRNIRKYKPRIILTSDPYRRYIGHRDHRIAGQAALDAVYPYARDHLAYPDLLDQGLEPHRVEEIWFWGSEERTYFSDITDTFDLKIAALECHQSQIGHRDLTMLREGMKKRFRQNAAEQSFDLAEVFHRVIIGY